MKDKIFIISHNSGIEGPIDYYSYYLRKKYNVIKLNHPLENYQGQASVVFNNREIISTRPRRNLSLLNLFLDFLISLKEIRKNKIDILIGANNFDTFTGIIAKKIFQQKIKKIIYFGSDFTNKKFENKVLNKIFNYIEKTVNKKADLIISNTKRAEQARLKIGLDPRKSLVIPNGVYLKDPQFPSKIINKRNFIFIGSVTKEHGLQEMIQILKPLIDELTIIGQGKEWNQIINFCQNNKINLKAYHQKSHDFVLKYLRNFNGFGLAPYNSKSQWTYYCSPLKINEYLSCGIPVIMSSIPEISAFIHQQKMGIVYGQNNFNFQQAIQDVETKKFSKKAKKFYNLYNYNVLFNKINLHE